MPIVTLNVQLINGPETIEELKQVQLASTQALRKGFHHVIRIEQRFKNVLKKGHTVDVGASGRSAQNILHEWQEGDNPQWVLFEGRRGANRTIRSGIKPGRKVSYNVLRKWAMDKGITLYYKSMPGETTQLKDVKQVSGFKYDSRWFKAVGTKPTRSKRKPDTSVTRNAIYALRFALFKHGTERPTADWYPLVPAGQGKFDYPLYVLENDSQFIAKELEDWGKLMIKEFLKRRS